MSCPEICPARIRLHNYFGVQVEWREDGIFLYQSTYAKDVLERYGFGDAHGCRSPMDTTIKLRAATVEDMEPGLPFRAATGSLMYLATSTRPDLAFLVGYLSRFVQHPAVAHAAAVKRVLRYLVETQNHGVFFKYGQDASVFDDEQVISIDRYCDADWGNCPDTRKSVTGYTMMLAGGPVVWAARRQSIVALSTAEADSCEACQEGRAMLNVLVEVLQNHVAEFMLGVDNQGTVALASRPSYSIKTRHIELRYHYRKSRRSCNAP